MNCTFKMAIAAFILVGGFARSVAAGPFEDGVAAYQRGDYATAMRLWRPLADQGNGDAQYNIGIMYDKGFGVRPNDATAASWHRKAADQGVADAQFELAEMYRVGRGVPQDYVAAGSWYRKAADQGYAPAQNDLGARYANGEGVPKNYAEAVKWFRKAADQGLANAQFNLGNRYAAGEGVQMNLAEAVKWFRKAADQGHPTAQSYLAAIYAAAAKAGSPTMPEAERLLVAAVEKGRAAYVAGANEMAQGAARPARAKEICAVLKDVRVTNWLGEVETLSSNSDGLGVLSIQIAKGISIKTWNNAISDTGDMTLIDPESAVFKQAVALRKGQSVRFGGQFFRNSTDCIREGSLTLKGSLTQPEFIFRFSDLTAIE